MAAEIPLVEVTKNITEIVAPQVTAPIDYHLNPMFDFSPFWGWPLWIWVLLGLGIIIAVVNLKYLRRRMIMAPVLNYLSALTGKVSDMQVWIMGKNKSFYIDHLRYHDDGVISFRNISSCISMWFVQTSMAIGHSGGIKNAILSDNYDTARDPIAEIALCTVIKKHNTLNPIQAEEKTGTAITVVTNENYIKDYWDFEKLCKTLELENPNGVEMDVYGSFDQESAQRYMPPNRTAGMFGADCIREARKKNLEQKEESNWIKFAPLGIAFGISLVAILFTYMYVHG